MSDGINQEGAQNEFCAGTSKQPRYVPTSAILVCTTCGTLMEKRKVESRGMDVFFRGCTGCQAITLIDGIKAIITGIEGVGGANGNQLEERIKEGEEIVEILKQKVSSMEERERMIQEREESIHYSEGELRDAVDQCRQHMNDVEVMKIWMQQQMKELKNREVEEVEKIRTELREHKEVMNGKIEEIQKNVQSINISTEEEEKEVIFEESMREEDDGQPFEVVEKVDGNENRVVIFGGDSNVVKMKDIVEDMVGETQKLSIIGQTGAQFSPVAQQIKIALENAENVVQQVIIHAGLIDILRSTSIKEAKETLAKEVKSLANVCNEVGAKMVVCSIPPVIDIARNRDYRKCIVEVNKHLKRVTETNCGEFLWLNYIPEVKGAMDVDGVHYSFEGQLKAARPLARRICKFLQKEPKWIHVPPADSEIKIPGRQQRQPTEFRPRPHWSTQQERRPQGQNNYAPKWISERRQNPERREEPFRYMEPGNYRRGNQDREKTDMKDIANQLEDALALIGKLAMAGMRH